jgi:2-phosphosulfolactate phosphatase
MKINVLFSPLFADELYFTGRTVVVIDVLRATSVIAAALSNGAKEIIPVGTVEFAVKVSGGMFGGQTLLGGERNTKKIEGFALGNSPLEYTPEVVNNKSIVFFTTNGSKAIVKAKFSANLFTCSFLNLPAVANKIAEMDQNIEIVCAGSTNNFALEDSVCAGRLVAELAKLKEDAVLTETASAALSLNKSFGKTINKMLAQTEHGKLLLENGFDDDIKFCSKYGIMEAVPAFNSGVIKLV